MCGISGAIGISEDIHSYLLQFNNALNHRGPDADGTLFRDNVFMGHRRLSIIDLESGAQPMLSTDSRYAIVYNGELYNYKDLKANLVAKGVQFKTESDTEVILNAYIYWGKYCIEKFRGMFAFAIVDFEKRNVILARDHFGIKPLIYHIGENGFYFASELSAFKKLPFLKFNINFEALDQYFWHNYIPAPNTIFEGFHKLETGHFLIVNFDGKIQKKERFWKFEYEPDYSKSFDDWKEETDHVLKKSVEKHLVSDVPFGAFLSGGIDSSLVVSYMSEIMNQPVKTFSIGFDDEQYNELDYARKIANKYQTDHHEEILSPDALSILPDLVSHYGEPFGDSSSLPTYYVSKLAGKNVKMVLSGDGGDEGFAGYFSYLRWQNELSYPGVPKLKRLLYPIGRVIFPYKYFKRGSYKHWMEIMRAYPYELRKNLYSSDKIKAKYDSQFFNQLFRESAKFDYRQKAQYMDLGSYLPYDILQKVDIASMSHSLEVRTPLIDIKVWEMLSKIPVDKHYDETSSQLNGKMILKEILSEKVDRDFAFREKKGFSVPLSKWFGNKTSQVNERITDSRNLNSLMDRETIKMIIGERLSNRVWLLLFLDEWLHQFNSSK